MPRFNRYVGRGWANSCRTITVSGAPGCGRGTEVCTTLIFTGSGVTNFDSDSVKSGQLLGTLMNGGLLPLFGPSPASSMLLKNANSR